MKHRTLLVALLIGSLVVGQIMQPARAATVTASSCALSAVQSAVNSASDGDTVVVPAGNCTWSGALSVNKTITLRGAGSDAGGTKITYGGSGHTLIVVDPGNKKGKTDISGFWFIGGDSNFWNGAVMQLWGGDNWKNLRVHHNVFEDNVNWAVVAYTGMHGLIDNNVFRGRGFGIKTYGDGAEDWRTSLVLGTADFLFVEANTFDYDDFYGSTGVPALDMNEGGRVVFRNNTLRYAFFETHDKARSTLASANAYEIYDNSFWTNSNKWKALDISAGTGVIFGNTFTGDWSVPIGAIDYKTSDPRSVRPCDGTDPADQNVPGESGWRCQYQIGSQGEGASAIGYPLYVWNNKKNGAVVGMECTDGCTHVKSGRDYINNGTTPKSGYTPFQFPHPLTGQSAPVPSPPKDLRVD